MGECLIVRRGGEAYKLPVLNASYPQDVTVVASASASATFRVQIAEPGNPAEYTYKWYKGGSVISGATGSTVTISGLTAAQTAAVYCEVTNKAGTVTSRAATLTVRDWKPAYTYTGNHQLIDDGSYNWRIKFQTSGTLKFTSLGNAGSIDVFCVGGGGSGTHASNDRGGGGGAGGYTTTKTAVSVAPNQAYSVVIGAGGVNGSDNNGATGGTTQFGSFASAAGGQSTQVVETSSGNGGNGGSGGGMSGYYGDRTGSALVGGTNGGNAAYTWAESGSRGKGQGTTTREFGESSGTLYSGGGSGANRGGDTTAISGGSGGGGTGGTGGNGSTNTGGGGGGHASGTGTAGSGGSGIVVIRNHR